MEVLDALIGRRTPMACAGWLESCRPNLSCPLPYSWLARTDPADVARVESKTFICTPLKSEAIPEPAPGVRGSLGNWISPGDMEKAIAERFPGCMKGKWLDYRC